MCTLLTLAPYSLKEKWKTGNCNINICRYLFTYNYFNQMQITVIASSILLCQDKSCSNLKDLQDIPPTVLWALTDRKGFTFACLVGMTVCLSITFHKGSLSFFQLAHLRSFFYPNPYSFHLSSESAIYRASATSEFFQSDRLTLKVRGKYRVA